MSNFFIDAIKNIHKSYIRYCELFWQNVDGLNVEDKFCVFHVYMTNKVLT